MKIRQLHDWDVPYKEATRLQQELRTKIQFRPLEISTISTIAGCDISVTRGADVVHGALVVLSFPRLEVLTVEQITLPATIPYIPGLLSFREGPAVVELFRRLDTAPDAVIFDGQGIAHPRRLGLAAHLGLWLNLPTIGCAKSRLTGSCEMPGVEKGSSTPLLDGEEKIGTVLRTRSGVKPVFVSPGHRCDFQSAVALIQAVTPRFRLPEPVRAAHRACNARRKEYETDTGTAPHSAPPAKSPPLNKQ